MLKRLLIPLATVVLCAGCTGHYLERDAVQTLEWLRLKHGTELAATTRWQIPRNTVIEVTETAAAPGPDWLYAARSGVESVFPPAGTPGTEPLQLIVSWPAADGGKPRGPRVALWEVVDVDQFLPGFAQPMTLQVALVRPSDGALLEAAQLNVTPRWFTSEATAPALVHGAFRSFAASLRPAY